MLLKNLNDLKRTISRTIILACLVIMVLSSLILYFTQNELNQKRELLNIQQVNSAFQLYQANLSEKLGIIANSNIFLDYLRSGKATQEYLLPDFLAQLNTMRDASIKGMRISDIGETILFLHGEKTNDYIDIKLCYLDRALNDEMGRCDYTWRLYFSKTALMSALATISQQIKPCDKCQPFNFIKGKQFGSFQVITNAIAPLNVKYEQPTENLFYRFMVIMLTMLVALTFWNRYRISYIVGRYLADPLQALTEKLKKNHVLQTEGRYLEELNFLISQLNSWKKELAANEYKKHAVQLGELAAQVAHDIRSPLAALQTALKVISQVPEEQRLLARSAVRRINDIANNLLQDYKHPHICKNTIKVEPIPLLIDEIVSEKRTQFAERTIHFNYEFLDGIQGLFAKVNASEFKRVLSNLINNSVEAIADNGEVTVSLSTSNNQLILAIQDSGCGISKDKLATIFEKGYSYGKAEGIGLGLSYAQSMIKAWGGQITLQSQVGQGTTVQIFLPQASSPSWIVRKLLIHHGQTLVILDDDDVIHQLWKSRLQLYVNQGNINEIIHFYNVTEFRHWFSNQAHKQYIFLIDYELGQEMETGLDVIEQASIAAYSILVTSRYDEYEIQTRCNELGVSVLPKRFASCIPIICKQSVIPMTNYELIFIDDDDMLTRAWSLSAEIKGKRILTFNTLEAFKAKMDELDKALPIYIDSDLKSTMRGEEFAKYLYEAGFKTIYLATGFEVQSIQDKPWLKGVVNKEPPF